MVPTGTPTPTATTAPGPAGELPTTLISRGAIWRYLDDGSDQGTAWRARAFDDAAWAAGPAELGYGDGDEATVVGFGPDPLNKHTTTYLRRAFQADGPAAFRSLTVRVRRDDGAVVYLNGSEVFRTNMPDGAITSTTRAVSSSTSETDFFEASVDPGLLVTGANVLAVEVHQQFAGSSDISFDLELVGAVSAPGPGTPTATPTPAPPPGNPTATPTRTPAPPAPTPTVTPPTPGSHPGGVPAFPGAEGWGAQAWQACDRSQSRVIEVTNLDDSGPGSLRAALTAPGVRIVVFKVAGRIELLSRIDVRDDRGNGCLYVAGQTAPGGGIWVSNDPVAASYSSIALQKGVHDVIIRSLRVRPNAGGAIDVDGGHDIILDHLSMGWTSDDILDIWYGATTRNTPISRVSVQRSLLSEPYARHATFMNIGGDHPSGHEAYVDRISIHHNLMGHASHRAPNISAASASVLNNVVYNTKWKGTITKYSTTTDIIGNYYLPGPMSVLATNDPNAPHAYRFLDHESTDPDLVPYTPGARLFVQGNVLRPGLTRTTADDWSAEWDEYLEQTLDPKYRRSPWAPQAPAPVPVTVASAHDAYNSIVLGGGVGDYRGLACDGTWVVRRDAVDQRLINDLKAGTQWFGYVDSSGARRYPDSLDEVGSYPAIDPGTPCADADHDGMSDGWEIGQGLNPHDPADAVRVNADGYTNLEKYINGR